MTRLILFLAGVLVAAPLWAVRITGEIRYENFAIDLDGFADPNFRPAGFVEVEIINAGANNAVLATTSTGPDGRFSVDVPGASQGTRIAIIAYSRNSAVNVGDNLTTYQWSTAASAQTVNSDPFDLGVLQIRENENAGALNILDVITAGRDYVAARTSRNIPQVRVKWRKGLVQRCGTCYTGDEIFLLSRLVTSSFDDTDEYDDSVIMHEYAHHIQEMVTCTSNPGGSHSSCEAAQNLGLAWSEGSAQYFSVVVGGLDPRVDQVSGYYLDSTGNFATGSMAAFRDNIEDNDSCPTSTYGIRNEDSVSRILWDLQDSVNDGADTFQLGERNVFEAMLNMQGSVSCDLPAFVGEVCELFAAQSGGFQPIFAAFNVPLPGTCTAPAGPRRRAVRR